MKEKQKLINLYTDGACRTNGSWAGGAGLYVELEKSKEYFYYCALETTNNIMELKAFHFALHYSYFYGDLDTEVNVYTDSAYVVNCLKNGWFVKWETNGWLNSKKEPVANRELWEEILGLYKKMSFHKLNIHKVKAHSGNPGNVLADKLAVKGRDEATNCLWRRTDEF